MQHGKCKFNFLQQTIFGMVFCLALLNIQKNDDKDDTGMVIFNSISSRKANAGCEA